jgi:hypothetical protein
MKRSSAALFALATLPTMASATYANSNCTNATIKGIYGFDFNGSTGGSPIAIVGTVTNDGAGNFSSTYTLSVGGTVTTGAQLAGTYNVNSDCTASFYDTTNDLHYTGVILRHGAETFVINADSGNTFTGDFKKQ